MSRYDAERLGLTEDNDVECPDCEGECYDADGALCQECDGTGYIERERIEDEEAEARERHYERNADY